MNWPKLMLSDDYLVWMQRIRATPDDDLPRLIFADWLEEKGDTVWCHLIRQQCGNVTTEEFYRMMGESMEEALFVTDPNRKPTKKEMSATFVGREVIEQVFPLLSGSYKLSRGFISEVSIAPNDYLKWDGKYYLWELLRITQPLFTVMVETNWDNLLTISAGRYPPHSPYQSLIDGTVIENRIKSGDVSPISKWGVR